MQASNVTTQVAGGPVLEPETGTSTIFFKARGRAGSLLRVVTSNPKIAVGLGIVAFFVLMALAAPLLTPYDPNAIVVRGSLPPSSAHIFGTTGLGQDMFAQIVYGARVSLVIGFFAATGSTVLQVFFWPDLGLFWRTGR
jgi:peptide/nickel transport system permease protein